MGALIFGVDQAAGKKTERYNRVSLIDETTGGLRPPFFFATSSIIGLKNMVSRILMKNGVVCPAFKHGSPFLYDYTLQDVATAAASELRWGLYFAGIRVDQAFANPTKV